MRIVITGTSGRVGRAIHVRLSQQHHVIGIDRAPSSTADVIGDLAEPGLLQRAFAGADAVIHTAALHAPHVGRVPDSEFERINIEGTHRVLDAAAAAHVARIVFTSTTALYGDAATPPDRAGWIDEAVQPLPRTIYHHTKLAAEAMLRDAASSGGPTVRILRMSRCFPEPAPLMALYRLHRGVDARDVAQAHALALTHAGAAHATFVISGPTPFRRDDCAALLRDARPVVRMRAPALAAAFDARGWSLPARIDRVYDATRAQQDLGWQPRHGFEAVLDMLDQQSSEVLPATSVRYGTKSPASAE